MRPPLATLVLTLIAASRVALAQPVGYDPMSMACTTSAREIAGDPGASMLVHCPPGCPSAPVWGAGVYSDDSSVCTAAVHAGVLAPGAEGLARVYIAPGLANYASTSQNGVTTSTWAEWNRSFFVVAEPASAPAFTGGPFTVSYGCPSCWVGLFTPESYEAAIARAAACHPHPEWYTDDPASPLHSLMWVQPSNPCLASVFRPALGTQTTSVAAGSYIVVGVRDGFRAVRPVDITGDMQIDLEPSLEFFDCGFSCPIVYVRSGGELVRGSEVLTDLRAADLEATQAVLLPSPDRADGLITVHIAEEEPELSYLDQVVVRADGRELAPTLCAADPTASVCADDGRYETLDLGQRVELVFDVSDVPEGTPLELAVNGYYIPLGVATAAP